MVPLYLWKMTRLGKLMHFEKNLAEHPGCQSTPPTTQNGGTIPSALAPQSYYVDTVDCYSRPTSVHFRSIWYMVLIIRCLNAQFSNILDKEPPGFNNGLHLLESRCGIALHAGACPQGSRMILLGSHKFGPLAHDQ